jgi:hypothetical protein
MLQDVALVLLLPLPPLLLLVVVHSYGPGSLPLALVQPWTGAVTVYARDVCLSI